MKLKKEIARLLLQSKAIKLEPTTPFTWASGWKSPIYCDNRRTLSFPEIRTIIRDELIERIEEEFGIPDVIAGVATGAIAQAALIGDKMKLPLIYVRSSNKSHGLENLIEGVIEAGQKIVVVEDLVSTGGSSLKAVDAIRKKGAEVIGMVAIFKYGFADTEEIFKKHNCKLVTLSDYDSLLEIAIEEGSVDEDQIKILQNWRSDPVNWGK